MRIALVTANYAPTMSCQYSGGGGVANIVRWLRSELLERGDEVTLHVLASSRKDVLSRRLLAPDSWRRAPMRHNCSEDPGLVYWGANCPERESQRYRPRRPLTRELDSYDLIQVVAGGPALALAVSDARPPRVLQVATTLLMERRAQLPEMPLIKRAIKAAGLRPLNALEVKAMTSVDRVLVENRWMEQWVKQQGQSNVIFAPPGIDTQAFVPVGEWDARRPIIAFGRLDDSRKDWPTAIEAFEHLVKMTGAQNDLVLAGKGPMTQSLAERLAVSPLRNRISVEEDIPPTALPTRLASGAVFLQSSREEGLGLAGLEAMACGLPVVATRTIGSSEYVVDGVNGFLVDIGPGAGEQLGKALASALRDGGALSARAVLDCRRSYSASVAIARFIDCYEALLAGGDGTRES